MEATSTLADALLDDLDDLSDVQEDETEDTNDNNGKGDVSPEDQKQPAATALSYHDVDGLTSSQPQRRRLVDDNALQSHLKAIRVLQTENSNSSLATKEEREHEHRLIVQSNKHLNQLHEELSSAHRELCASYEPKFPELEELVPDALQYCQAVRVIGNEMDMTRVNDPLHDFLSSNQIITMSVAGSTTAGRPLTEEELQEVDAAATYVERVVKVQQEMTQFVESRMEALAPSICHLIGPTLAARMMGLAGGLAELSKIPACNLQVIGQVQHNSASRGGLSTSANNRGISNKPHTGILANCDLVQRCPAHLQTKALKMVAGKLALAARCDFVNVDTGRPRTDSAGRNFRKQIEGKFVKLQEPDKAPVLKALPKPDLTVKKRRGGKRMRRLKERYEETAMMEQANTRAFSTQTGEYGDDAMGLTLGLLDTADVSAGGALRKNTGEKKKMKFANTRASRKRAAQMNAQASNNPSSGLASSMVFTPVQGMELVNPDANKDRVREANKKWFSENAGFQSALPK